MGYQFYLPYLQNLTLSQPALSCHPLPYPAMSYPILPFPTLSCHALPCPALPYHVLPCPTLPCHGLPCRALPYPSNGTRSEGIDEECFLLKINFSEFFYEYPLDFKYFYLCYQLLLLSFKTC